MSGHITAGVSDPGDNNSDPSDFLKEMTPGRHLFRCLGRSAQSLNMDECDQQWLELGSSERTALEVAAKDFQQPLSERAAELQQIAIDLRHGYRELFNGSVTTVDQDRDYFGVVDRADKILEVDQ